VSEHILITGASGYVGMRMARRYLAETDAELTLQVRARDAADAESKRAQILRQLGEPSQQRVHFVHTDLSNDAPFSDVDATHITSVLHSAAITRFNIEEDAARVANIDGTRKVLALAERCPRLDTLGLLSTVYSSGLLPGPVLERQHSDADGFANNYEWSKHAAEQLAFQASSKLPLRIIRIATLFADDSEGNVTQYNAFHNTMKLYYYGLLSLMPGKTDTPVYLVTGDFVSDSVFGIMRSRQASGVYHVAHESEHNPTLGELIDLVFGVYERDETYRKKRVLRPLFTDDESFDILAETVDSFGSPVTRQALQSMTPFARQLYIKKSVENTRLRREISGYQTPDYRAQIERTMQRLIATKWGRAQAA